MEGGQLRSVGQGTAFSLALAGSHLGAFLPRWGPVGGGRTSACGSSSPDRYLPLPFVAGLYRFDSFSSSLSSSSFRLVKRKEVSLLVLVSVSSDHRVHLFVPCLVVRLCNYTGRKAKVAGGPASLPPPAQAGISSGFHEGFLPSFHGFWLVFYSGKDVFFVKVFYWLLILNNRSFFMCFLGFFFWFLRYARVGYEKKLRFW